MNFCTSCGQPRPAGARFCTSCGTPFATGTGDEPVPAQPEPPPAPEQPWQGPEGTPWQEPGAAQPDQPTGPVEPAGPAQQENWAGPQDTLVQQPETWTSHQDTWAAQPAGFAAQPEAPPGAGAGAPDDPFAHFFRDAPGDQTGPGGGFAGPPGPGYGETMATQPPYPESGPPGEQPPRRNRARAITLLAGVVVVLAAGGVGAWAALGGKGHPSAQSSHGTQPASTAPSHSPQPSTSAPSTSPAPSHSPGSSGMVAAAPSVRGQHDERAVLAFLNRYFIAINTHNYQQYYGLLDAQQQRGITQGQFDSGYRKTRDSHATLVALGLAGGGGVAASITFTSHQPASDSPSHSSCTDWNTTLYLRPQSGSYAIEAPPASYHAAYQAC